MTTYYCDPLASGNNDGTTPTHAWQSLQEAIDGVNGTIPTAGDVVLCRAQDGSTADESPTVTIDIDQAGGSVTGGLLTFRGVNSSWTDDGTRYVIDGSGLASGSPILKADQTTDRDYLAIENFYVHSNDAFNNDNTGFKANANQENGYRYFRNCRFSNCYNGVYNYRCFWTSFYRCVFDGNTSNGIYYSAYAGTAIFEYCSFLGNSTGLHASNIAEGIVVNGCIFDNNSSNGIIFGGQASYIHNSVFTRNSPGIYYPTGATHGRIRGCRFAYNSTYGIQCQTVISSIEEDYNVFYSNSSGNRSNIGTGGNSLNASNATELGFTDHASASWNRDFNLTTSAILRSTAIVVPVS